MFHVTISSATMVYAWKTGYQCQLDIRKLWENANIFLMFHKMNLARQALKLNRPYSFGQSTCAFSFTYSLYIPVYWYKGIFQSVIQRKLMKYVYKIEFQLLYWHHNNFNSVQHVYPYVWFSFLLNDEIHIHAYFIYVSYISYDYIKKRYGIRVFLHKLLYEISNYTNALFDV